MLEVTNLGCVRGARRLFKKIAFSVRPGTFLQITGPNGSGKTSLLRIICGLMEAEEGEIKWEGANIKTLGEDYSRSFTYIGHRSGVKEELTSVENLRIASGLTGFDLTETEARRALAQVGLAGRENLPARLLSEGQRRRSVLARLITGDTTLWVLDEVLASLDVAAARMIESLIEGHLRRGGMAIVATHQPLRLSAGSIQQLELSTELPSASIPLESAS